jgi:hypothetical protein
VPATLKQDATACSYSAMGHNQVEQMTIRNFRLIGDGHVNGNWADTDLELVTSPVGVSKIEQAFRTTPYNFNFNLIIDKQHNISKGVQIASERVGDQLCDANAINVILTNNVTAKSNYIPPTAWILAHRVGHTIQVSDREIENNFWKSIYELTTELAGNVGNHPPPKRIIDNIRPPKGISNNPHPPADVGIFRHKNYEYCIADSSRGTNILHMLMTMRSCRTGQFRHGDNLDYFCELLAQFVITGKITLRRYQDWDEHRTVIIKTDPMTKKYYSDDYVYDKYGNEPQPTLPFIREILCLDVDNIHTPEKIDSLVGQIEAIMNKEMVVVLDQLVGKVWAF